MKHTTRRDKSTKCYRIGDNLPLPSILLLLFIFLSLPVQAESLRFKTLNSVNGLPQNTVRAIAQDQNGLMWFATEDGVARYDGQNIKVYRYDPTSDHALRENTVNGFASVGSQLWISTQGEGGIAVLDQAKQSFDPVENLPNATAETVLGNVVMALYQRGKNVMLAGSTNGVFSVGIDSLAVTKQLISKQQLASKGTFSGIWEDTQKNLWTATTDGKLAYLTPDGELIIVPHQSNTFYGFRHIPALGDVLVANNGLMKIDYLQNSLTPLFSDTFLHNVKVRDIAQSPEGHVWIATRSGLIRYDPINDIAALAAKNSDDENSLPTNELNTLFISEEGILWLGTVDKGVVYTNVKGFGFKSYSTNNVKIIHPKQLDTTKSNSFKNNTIWSIFRDSRDTLWLGHSEGLSRQEKSEKAYTNLTALGVKPKHFDISESWLMSITEANGYLWFGTWGEGLIRYDPNTEELLVYSVKSSDEKTKLSGNVIRLLLPDEKRNALWIGTHYHGLNRLDFNTGKITHYLPDATDIHAFPHERTRALHLDKQDRLWVGTGDGVALFDDDKQHFNRVKKYPSGEATTDIRGLYQSDDNTLWSATGYGLDRINISTLEAEKKYLEADGLSRSTLYGIIADDHGDLWLPTVRGLTRFTIKNESFKRYFLGHNLQSNEFNFNAYMKEKDGTIIAGGVGGITIFDPPEVHPNDTSYRPIVLGIKGVDDTFTETAVLGVTKASITNKKAFTLAANQRSIIIDLTIPEYTFTEDLEYEYHLLTDKDNWQSAKPRDIPIRYTNLTAGKHTFQVRRAGASNNSQPLTINFTIDKYLWEEYWFWALITTLLGFIGLYGFRTFSSYRLEKQIAQERAELYSMVVHDLGPALKRSQTSIQALSGTAATKADQSLLSGLQSDNQYSLSFINQLRSLSTVEGFSEKQKDNFLLEDIVDESVNSFRADKNRIEVTDIPDCSVYVYENSLEFIIKNLIDNAIKYSENDTPVRVDIQQSGNDITIAVADNGIGISEAFRKYVFEPYERSDYYKTEGLGVGLTLVKSITQKYKGDIAIEDNQPSGTIIIVTLRNIVVM